MCNVCIIMTTFGKKEDARIMAKELVKEKKAACVQMQEINSVYEWENEVCDDSEVLVYIKTRDELYEEVRDFISKRHPYDTPEIVKIKIDDVDEKYVKWLLEQTRGEE